MFIATCSQKKVFWCSRFFFFTSALCFVIVLFFVCQNLQLPFPYSGNLDDRQWNEAQPHIHMHTYLLFKSQEDMWDPQKPYQTGWTDLKTKDETRKKPHLWELMLVTVLTRTCWKQTVFLILSCKLSRHHPRIWVMENVTVKYRDNHVRCTAGGLAGPSVTFVFVDLIPTCNTCTTCLPLEIGLGWFTVFSLILTLL